MKILSRLLSVFTILTLSIVFMGCPKPDPDPIEPTQKEKVTEMLTSGNGTWSTAGSSGITVDGTDVTQDLFEGFTITFGATSYTTTGTTPVFLRTDTWSFKDDNANVILRGQDNKEITITSVSATQLKLSLVWDQTTYEEGGRRRSIPGTYEFTLNK